MQRKVTVPQGTFSEGTIEAVVIRCGCPNGAQDHPLICNCGDPFEDHIECGCGNPKRHRNRNSLCPRGKLRPCPNRVPSECPNPRAMELAGSAGLVGRVEASEIREFSYERDATFPELFMALGKALLCKVGKHWPDDSGSCTSCGKELTKRRL